MVCEDKKTEVKVRHHEPKVRVDKPRAAWISFTESNPEDWEGIREYYGLKDFPSDQLLIQKTGEKTITFVSSSIRNFLGYDKKGQLIPVNLG
jgi:hypothetical protein